MLLVLPPPTSLQLLLFLLPAPLLLQRLAPPLHLLPLVTPLPLVPLPLPLPALLLPLLLPLFPRVPRHNGGPAQAARGGATLQPRPCRCSCDGGRGAGQARGDVMSSYPGQTRSQGACRACGGGNTAHHSASTGAAPRPPAVRPPQPHVVAAVVGGQAGDAVGHRVHVACRRASATQHGVACMRLCEKRERRGAARRIARLLQPPARADAPSQHSKSSSSAAAEPLPCPAHPVSPGGAAPGRPAGARLRRCLPAG